MLDFIETDAGLCFLFFFSVSLLVAMGALVISAVTNPFRFELFLLASSALFPAHICLSVIVLVLFSGVWLR